MNNAAKAGRNKVLINCFTGGYVIFSDRVSEKRAKLLFKLTLCEA
jgi:hypothetical protein